VERAATASFTSAIVTVDAGQTTSLSGLTIARGNGGGVANNGTLTVSGSTVSGNSETGYGGGGILNAGALTLSGSILTGNSASEAGGGIYNDTYATLTLSKCTVTQNTTTAHVGGADLYNLGFFTNKGSKIGQIGP